MTDPPTPDRSELPWVISVDDHVVEPPHVWETWLPERYRGRGPRVVQDRCETIIEPGAAAARYVRGGDGPVLDWWVFEDVLRPIPQVMACVGFPRDQLTVAPIRFDEMRRGCWDPAARLADMDLNRTERSMCFPTMPRFAGQVFTEAVDKELALACVRAYNDWMVEEWCGDSGGRLIPLRSCPCGTLSSPPRRSVARPPRGAPRSPSPSSRRSSACPRSTTSVVTGIRSSRRATRPAP